MDHAYEVVPEQVDEPTGRLKQYDRMVKVESHLGGSMLGAGHIITFVALFFIGWFLYTKDWFLLLWTIEVLVGAMYLIYEGGLRVEAIMSRHDSTPSSP